MVPFSECEEAFLLTNIRHVINVWSRGSGQARLNFCVRNGQAELSLSYQLGHPEESHLPTQPPHHHQEPHLPHPRRKSQKRRLRDNIRAANFQAARAGIRPAVSTAVQTSSSSARVVTSTAAASTGSISSLSSSSPAISAPSHGHGLVTQHATTSVTFSLPSPILPTVVTPVSVPTPSHSAVVETQADSFPADQSVESEDSILGLLDPYPVPSRLATTFTPFNMPARKFADCTHCAIDFEDLVYPVPCYNCGEWFHLQCLPGHACELRDDIFHSSDIS